eukprot:TRINITY_DN5943_c0_g1_i2.p1 TRINITY_DN5943_c0_g1~~TRINITY_DN5943_c0_g1_i2.p1  ORF type:complete len:2210 (-),score=393.95 TRINITY_DN5943_c0_g1_i2:143-6772(-)
MWLRALPSVGVVAWFACAAAVASLATRVLAVCALVGVALFQLRLHPRKVIEISWSDLLAAWFYIISDLTGFSGGASRRKSVEAAISREVSPHGDALAFLSVRSGMDLLLAAMDLPKDSEVVMAPAITIPSVVQLIEARGLRTRCLEPRSATELMPPAESLKAMVTENTRVLVVTHLFGAVFDSVAIIREAKRLGLFVIEDGAQSFLQKSPSAGSLDSVSDNFRWHKDSDACFSSFGLIKTMTCLGGCIGCIRDKTLRDRMCEMEAKYPIRSTRQFAWATSLASASQLTGSPTFWGLFAACCGLVGDFDKMSVNVTRGFPGSSNIKQRASMPLLRLMRRRLRSMQRPTSIATCQATACTRRRIAGERLAQRLTEGGVEVLTQGMTSAGWWLVPVLDDNPKRLTRAIVARGFDATCSATQLVAVASVAKKTGTSMAQLCAAVKKNGPTASEDIMRRVVYLPLSQDSTRSTSDALANAVLEARRSVEPSVPTSASKPVWLGLLALAVILACKPAAVCWLFPSTNVLFWAVLVFVVGTLALVFFGRRFARTRGLRISTDMLRAMNPQQRVEGVAFVRSRPPFAGAAVDTHGRVDGAVLLTGATGFVGGGILFGLLAQARELGITRIVILVRKKSSTTAEVRLAALRKKPAFAEVTEAFDELVSVLEGDVAVQDFGWSVGAGDGNVPPSNRPWPYQETLKAVVHCAGDVRFNQPLQKATVSLVSASVQTAHLAARWGAQRYIFVSTAFVHPAPPQRGGLLEQLVDLRDFDPWELYRDAVNDGRWSGKVMRELGFPNTYTFAKAIAEHIATRRCSAEGVEARIVRPSIVGPAWAAPFAGWCGDKPSTVVGAAVLLAKRALRIFRIKNHPTPIVPVDFVAETVFEALVSPVHGKRILHATVDASQADRLLSFRVLVENTFKVLALRGEMSLPEAGFLCCCLRWADNDRAFWVLHKLLNVAPLAMASKTVGVAARIAGDRKLWQSSVEAVSIFSRMIDLPVQYLSFSSPLTPWLFRSGLRLPEDWDAQEYNMIIYSCSAVFVKSDLREAPVRTSRAAFRDARISPPRGLYSDLVVSLSTPGVPLYLSLAAFVIRRGLGWVGVRITVDAASLEGAARTVEPLVLCSQHRSLLDFLVLGLVCFELKHLVPVLQVPYVAADAEFSGLPGLGYVLKALGAFFVRRGGGGVQPDPALRAEVSRVFRKGGTIEVFLEGQRSRGRRQLRLRSGLLRAMNDVQSSVALVPVSLSYEFLPEDQSFHDELQGKPRVSLSTLAFVRWALRGVRGELPPLGNARVVLGTSLTFDSTSSLTEVLPKVQHQLVSNTAITSLHVRALAEGIGLPKDRVMESFQKAGISVMTSSLPAGRSVQEAELWTLALQAAMMFRDRLPTPWSQWLVEPIREGIVGLDAKKHVATDIACDSTCVDDSSGDGSGIDAVAAALNGRLEAALAITRGVAKELTARGTLLVTEKHLLNQLVSAPRSTNRSALGSSGLLPVLLAHGAAQIVAAELLAAALKTDDGSITVVPTAVKQGDAGPSEVAAAVETAARKQAMVEPLWPSASMQVAQRSESARCNAEALDRWGFKDTRFIARFVDGAPAVQVTSTRYAAVGGRPLSKLWTFFKRELAVPMTVREDVADRPLPSLPAPAEGLEAWLLAGVPSARVRVDAEARLRAGTGHGLQDIWKLRSREVGRMPDAVVRPESEEEVLALLRAAAGKGDGTHVVDSASAAAVPFAVVPVGGRTNVTSATAVPERDVDPRPFVALDMRGLAKVRWVNAEDGVAMVEAGINGMELKEYLRQKGLNMGMEPDSMEFSTLGGWISTRASGMKRARYGNIEDMILEVRLATPAGLLWQHHDCPAGDATSRADTSARTAFGRVSTNLSLPSVILGSEGCLGVVVAATVRVRPLPEVIEYDSVVFKDWDQGAMWMRSVARLPAALRPASCRLLDRQQLSLAAAIREDPSQSFLTNAAKEAWLWLQGVRLDEASAATLVFEGSRDEVALQRRSVRTLVRQAGGVWGGASSGEAGYALTFAIAYLRDFGLDYDILSESLETLAPWSNIAGVWPAVVAAVEAEHRSLRLPGRPFLSCRMTQIYDEGGVLYMYVAVCTAGLGPALALEAFTRLEHAARRAALDAGGCLSHHHGVGKLRASLLTESQAPALKAAAAGLKAALDPDNILGARNGPWAAAEPAAETLSSNARTASPATLSKEEVGAAGAGGGSTI